MHRPLYGWTVTFGTVPSEKIIELPACPLTTRWSDRNFVVNERSVDKGRGGGTFCIFVFHLCRSTGAIRICLRQCLADNAKVVAFLQRPASIAQLLGWIFLDPKEATDDHKYAERGLFSTFGAVLHIYPPPLSCQTADPRSDRTFLVRPLVGPRLWWSLD